MARCLTFDAWLRSGSLALRLPVLWMMFLGGRFAGVAPDDWRQYLYRKYRKAMAARGCEPEEYTEA